MMFNSTRVITLFRLRNTLLLVSLWGAGTSAQAQALTSYFGPADQSSHVYYINSNQHIEHIWTTG